jgi:hypothetical protein
MGSISSSVGFFVNLCLADFGRYILGKDSTMKLLALGFLAITAVTLVGTNPSRAVPANGSSIAASLVDISDVDQVVFCYNKNTGAFAHWGRCRVVCYGPGGYCRKVTW